MSKSALTSITASTATILSNMDVAPSSREAYRHALGVYANYLSTTGRQGDRADLIAFREDCLRRGLKPATINGYLSAIRSAATTVSNITGAVSPLLGVRGVKTAKRFRPHLQHEQARRLLQAAQDDSPRTYAMVSLMLHTGLREAEVVRADVGDMSTINGVLVLRIQGKGHACKDDFVLLPPRAETAIHNYLSTRQSVAPDAPLIATTAKGREGKRLTTRSVRRIIHELLQAIGADTDLYSAHSLRHTVAVELINAGKSILDVQDVLRHKSADTTRIYLESIRDERRLAQKTEYAINY